MHTAVVIGAAMVLIGVVDYASDWLLRPRRLLQFRSAAARIAGRTGLRITIEAVGTRFSVTVVRETVPNASAVTMVDPLPPGDVKPWLFGIEAGYKLATGKIEST